MAKRQSKRVTKRPKSNKLKTRKSKKSGEKGVQRGGRKLNAYFKTMLSARKQDLQTFSYNGNTYKQMTTKTGLKMYKKA